MKYLDEDCIHDTVKLSHDMFLCEQCGKEFMSMRVYIHEHYDRHKNKHYCKICNP